MSESTPQSLTFRYVAVTDVGRRRSMNQDSGYAGPNLLVIADGMGGAAAGDLASAEAMHVVRKLDAKPEGDPLEALAGAVHRANDRLAEVIESDSETEGMGTTLTALLWDGSQFGLAHIGDSRGYQLRDGELTQITKDHTFVQSLVDEGKLTPEEARVHPHRSLILRVLLGSDDAEPDLSMIEPQAGDRYLLCSDGLSDMVGDPDIERALGAENIDVAAVELVRMALEGGGADNITVIIGEVVPADEPPDPNLAGASGGPMLVGAASEHARPRDTDREDTATNLQLTPDGDEDSAGPATETLDPEELRYAPRPPQRFRWLRRIVAVVVVLGLFALGGKLAYDWSQDQYYVAEADGQVAIYQGVQADAPLVDLHHVYEITEVSVDALPTFRREQLASGIASSSLDDARDSVQSLRDLAQKCADPEQASAPGSECEGAS